jgi:hypothetical protein
LEWVWNADDRGFGDALNKLDAILDVLHLIGVEQETSSEEGVRVSHIPLAIHFCAERESLEPTATAEVSEAGKTVVVKRAVNHPKDGIGA